mmetsp:Transcript_23588/g.47417  ORF Transcript_23588/g.47417 Transcript_23588/m.47417 type:complete len:181 (-) Transcript_23588:90-632(-)
MELYTFKFLKPLFTCDQEFQTQDRRTVLIKNYYHTFYQGDYLFTLKLGNTINQTGQVDLYLKDVHRIQPRNIFFRNVVYHEGKLSKTQSSHEWVFNVYNNDSFVVAPNDKPQTITVNIGRFQSYSGNKSCWIRFRNDVDIGNDHAYLYSSQNAVEFAANIENFSPIFDDFVANDEGGVTV